MNILDHLKQRRTVRRFKPDAVPQNVLDAMFDAAMWAPSHANSQPWEFVVVGPESRAKLLAIYRAKAEELLSDPDLPAPKRNNLTILKEDFGGAPYMVAIIARAPGDDLEKVENPPSTAAAVQNMLLAAWDHGIGAVWLSLGVVPPARGVLGIGEGETVVALLAMGHPAEVPPAPPRDSYSDRLRQVP